jgi:hypothetical protein
MAGQQPASPGINTDIDRNFEPGLATRVNNLANGAGGLIPSVQIDFSNLDPLDTLAG